MATHHIFEDEFSYFSCTFLAGCGDTCYWLQRKCFKLRKVTLHYNGPCIILGHTSKFKKVNQTSHTLAMDETGLSAKISPQIILDHTFITLGHTSNELKHKNATMHHTGPCTILGHTSKFKKVNQTSHWPWMKQA